MLSRVFVAGLDKHPRYLLTNPAYCPFNFYRSGGDNGPSFHGGMWNMLGMQLPYLKVTTPVPASRPGCWAYMDMLSIGAPKWGSDLQKQAINNGCPPMSLQEETSLFAGWVITSSPLILSFDVVNDTAVQRLWNLISNEVALNISATWDGEAGRLLKQSAHQIGKPLRYGAACEAGASWRFPDWAVWTKRLGGGKLAALAINIRDSPLAPTELNVSLAELQQAAGTASPSFAGTEVWQGEALATVTPTQPWVIGALPSRGSLFAVFVP